MFHLEACQVFWAYFEDFILQPFEYRCCCLLQVNKGDKGHSVVSPFEITTPYQWTTPFSKRIDTKHQDHGYDWLRNPLSGFTSNSHKLLSREQEKQKMTVRYRDRI